MRVVFMGTPDFAAESLAALSRAGVDIAGVFTQPDRPKGRGMKLAACETKKLALELGYPVYQPESLKTGEAAELLRSLAPELLCVVAYGKFYLPGLFPHHSLTLATAYQTSIGGFKRDNTLSFLSYTSSSLLPRGFSTSDISNRNYIATSVNYQLPVWYPEGGIASIIYFKRIRLNVGFDYATFNYSQLNMLSGSMRTHRRHLFSYGGDITFDINLFRQPAAATSSITISVYKPSKGPIYIGGGVGLPF